MNDVLSIIVGTRNGSDRRKVEALYGTESVLVDHFNTDSDFQRSKFGERLKAELDQRYGMLPDLEWIGGAIVEEAGKVDANGDKSHKQEPMTIALSDVEPEPVRWLWPGRIALGKLTLLVGDPGLGKSFLSLDLASRVTTGARWPDCAEHAPQGGVVILSAEDDPGDTIRPRCDAAGADVARIIVLSGIKAADEAGDYVRMVDVARDIDAIEVAIGRCPGCKLIIVDPLSAYLGATDSHKNSDVRAVLSRLSDMASRLGIAIVAVTHLRKGEGPAIYRSIGSLAFVAAARAAWVVTRDKHDEKRRLMLPLKNNIGPDQSGLAFELTARYGDTGQPYLLWSPEPVTTSAEEALAVEPRPRGPAPVEADEAERYLADALADGPKPARDIEADAREGHGIAKRTLDRARSALGIEAFREKVPGPWLLRLPKDANKDASLPRDKLLGNLGNLAESSVETVEIEEPEPNIANNAKYPETWDIEADEADEHAVEAPSPPPPPTGMTADDAQFLKSMEFTAPQLHAKVQSGEITVAEARVKWDENMSLGFLDAAAPREYDRWRSGKITRAEALQISCRLWAEHEAKGAAAPQAKPKPRRGKGGS